jgi:hypothetical protein
MISCITGVPPSATDPGRRSAPAARRRQPGPRPAPSRHRRPGRRTPVGTPGMGTRSCPITLANDIQTDLKARLGIPQMRQRLAQTKLGLSALRRPRRVSFSSRGPPRDRSAKTLLMWMSRPTREEQRDAYERPSATPRTPSSSYPGQSPERRLDGWRRGRGMGGEADSRSAR